MGETIISKVYAIEIGFLKDKEAFDFWYAKMPSFRREKIDAMKPLKGKLLSLGAGILLEKGLEEFGFKGAKIALLENKKPYIVGADSLCFNLSHSGSMAVCAFSDHEVGIDVEKNKAFKDSLIEYVFDDREVRFVDETAKSEEERNALFTRLWTMKESVMKYSGKGISMVPKSIFVDLAKEVGDGSLEIYHEGKKLENLHITTYIVPEYEEYQISVCSGYEQFSEAVELFKAP